MPLPSGQPAKASLAVLVAFLALGGFEVFLGLQAARMGAIAPSPEPAGVFAARADSEATRVANRLVPLAPSGERMAAALRRMVGPGAQYELAIRDGGRTRVLAASESALVGMVPEGGLLDALRGHNPAGEFEGAAGHPDFYTTYVSVVVPAPAAPARLALRLSLPVAPQAQAPALRPAIAPGPWGWLALALGLAATWGLGGALLQARANQLRSAQARRVLDRLDRCFQPQPRWLEAETLRSPFQPQLASVFLASARPGGAYTDWLALDDSRLAIVIGDATGWDTPALVYRGLANAFWRAKAPDVLGPGVALCAVNRLLIDYIAQGNHVTAFAAEVDLHAGLVRFASASHTGAYRLDAHGELSPLGGRGLPLGVGQELFESRLELGEVRLEAGDSLLLFTDGLLKAENAHGEPFGFERLARCLREEAGLAADLLASRIKKAVTDFAAPTALLPDDAAIMCLRLASRLTLATGPEAPPREARVSATEPA